MHEPCDLLPDAFSTAVSHTKYCLRGKGLIILTRGSIVIKIYHRIVFRVLVCYAMDFMELRIDLALPL